MKVAIDGVEAECSTRHVEAPADAACDPFANRNGLQAEVASAGILGLKRLGRLAGLGWHRSRVVLEARPAVHNIQARDARVEHWYDSAERVQVEVT